MSMTLLGDVAVSLWITTSADRVGRKWMLLVGAVLMALAGAVFLSTDDFWLLLAAATVGVISPTGNEVGPFLAIEQAALAQVVTAEQRTSVFAWYNLTGSLATAFGSLFCGLIVQGLHDRAGFSVSRVIASSYGFMPGSGRSSRSCSCGCRRRPRPVAARRPRPHGAAVPRPASFARRGVRAGGAVRPRRLRGGFVIQSAVVEWFQIRFGADAATLGAVFWAANVLAGFSALAAAAVARRVGLLRTMVFTHVPSNVLLILVPFMPNLPLAIAMLLLRFSISQMDVPARQSYTAVVVSPDERSAAAGVTGVARTGGAALSPYLVGLLLAPALAPAGWLFIVSGGLKLIYDGLVYWRFRAPPCRRRSRRRRPGEPGRVSAPEE